MITIMLFWKIKKDFTKFVHSIPQAFYNALNDADPIICFHNQSVVCMDYKHDLFL